MNKIKAFTLIALLAFSVGFSRGVKQEPAPVASTQPSPVPSPISSNSPVPAPSGAAFVSLAPGSSQEPKLAQGAIALMNDAVASGCLRSKTLAHKGFKSFNSVFEDSPKTALEAYNKYVAGAPYALDLRKYYTWRKVYGYTYNFKGDDWDSGTETRIWTNTRYVWDTKAYAAHLAHELSHQARAGGYVHYTTHQGSFPYEIGDLMGECVGAL
jgi:hypothetical protein